MKYEAIDVIIPEQQTTKVSLRLLEGKYADTVVRIEKAGVDQENTAELKVDYTLVSSPIEGLVEDDLGLQEALIEVFTDIVNETADNLLKEDPEEDTE